MLFVDYLYFQCLRWMERQERDHPHDWALRFLIGVVGMYVMAAVAISNQVFDLDITSAVGDRWPALHPNARYLRPEHALGLLVAVASGLFVFLVYGRNGKREAVISRFASRATKTELRFGPAIAIGAFVSTVFLIAAIAFEAWNVVISIFSAHVSLYIWVRVRHR